VARSAGLRQPGTVAIDTTRIKASASPDRVLIEQQQGRAQVRSWQQAASQDDSNEGAGGAVTVPEQAMHAVEPQLQPLPKPRLERAYCVVRRALVGLLSRNCAPSTMLVVSASGNPITLK
jgi:hypothetical protein